MASRDWLEKDYYKVLGVAKSASKDEIRKAYRKLAQQYHPDANKHDAAAEARFKEISEAHSVLSNEEKRREYDQIRSLQDAGGQRWYGFNPGRGGGNVRINIGDLFGNEGAGGDVGSLFDDLFGFGARGPQRGGDLETEVELDFEDAMNGTTVTLPGGTKARIPAGVAKGARVRVAGRGQAGPNGGPSGDMFVKVRVKPHPIFEWSDSGQLLVKLPVTFAEAALGAKVAVPTPEGSVTLKIPAGTANGKVMRVKGKGAPRGRGDLLVRIEVQVPQKLSNKEKELLEKFAEIHKDSPRAHLDAFADKRRSKAAS